MSIDIEFRLWSYKKEMISFENLKHWTFEDIEIFNKGESGSVLIQFTGLKDKKGVKLFEGDICQYDNNKSMSHWTRGERFVIVKNKGRFSARMKPYNEYDGCNQNTLNEEFEDCITKIGNIFQNPKLLKK